MKSLLSLGVVAIVLLWAAGCETAMTAVIAWTMAAISRRRRRR